MDVKLFATAENVKGSPVWDVYVDEVKTGQLRRLMKKECWDPAATWGYFSSVANDNYQWYSFQQAEGSLRNFAPRKRSQAEQEKLGA